MKDDQAQRLATAFQDQFGGEVEVLPEEGSPGRYQFAVQSPKFSELTTLRRQDVVWEVIDRVLSREDTLDVVMVWTFVPGEVNEWLQGSP